jgi:hypothetical protein
MEKAVLDNRLEVSFESLKTELSRFKDKPYKCLFEYIWNSFDAGATEVKINYELPKSEIGYIRDISIEDNGKGWDFKNEKNTKTFLASSKQNENKKNKSLPRGKDGSARYVFIWIADYLEVFSSKQMLKLNKDTKVEPIPYEEAPKKGTKIVIYNPINIFCDILYNEESLRKELILQFCWFLKQNPSFNIMVNDKNIDLKINIEKEKTLHKKDFDADIQNYINDNFHVNIVLWKEKPAEWSSFYFMDNNDRETFTKSTGMNKKNDAFWHSVYVKSDLFKDDKLEDDETINNKLDFGENEIKKKQNSIIKILKQKLIELRKPYLIQQSDNIILNLKEDNLIPKLSEFGIYDEESYEYLLKTIYTISPSLFVGRDKKEKKFICATFAGLLSTQDNNLIKLILEQLQDLSDSEKKDLLDILKRTSLANVVKTIKEIDNRLQVIDDLQKLLFEYEKPTLEVKHLQKVLNDNFWIFGEQFRLFSNTEGRLKDTLFKYSKDILKIDNPPITTQSRSELDLFLVKTESENENRQRNIVVEIKRPSKKLGKNEYDQIEKYSIVIMKESVCNSKNMYWEFYLIGNDYDDYIAKTKIENARSHGEIQRGLTSSLDEGRIKIYVRKWSDILQVEWRYKMKYLREKLEIQSKDINYKSPDDIVENLLKK